MKSSIVDRQAALRYLPGLGDHQHTLYEACTRNGINWNHAAILLSADEVGINQFHGDGPVLIANIPLYLQPHLAQVVTTQPEIINIDSLDLQDTDSFAVWSVKDGDGRLHSVAVHASILPNLLTQTEASDSNEISFARVAFCCGDAVAMGGFWFDEDDLFEAQAAGMCSQSYFDYSEAERIAAEAKVIKAGSPTPWIATPWQDDDGSMFTQLPVCSKQ
ncbi:hypothetical protein [Duganella sp. LjRoot269]|uniref:hypothetical protein n=1 Tax=Duganella sp. LjRoot269 TaxID=3342305 RepID=UPI003ED0B866